MRIKKIIQQNKKIIRESLMTLIVFHAKWWFTQPNYRQTHSFISPNIKFYDLSYGFVKYIYWLFYPLALYLTKNNFFISINNIPWSPGHIYHEIDYLNRIVHSDIKFKNSRILYVYPNNKILNGVKNIISTDRVKIITSGFGNLILYPLAMLYPQIAVDASLSSINHSLARHSNSPRHRPYEYIFRVLVTSYVELLCKTSEFYPLKKNRPVNIKLKEFIGFSKYIVIQIKDIRCNATFNPVNPETYSLVIEYFTKLGFGIVFAGREKMPEIFKRLKVINYSESIFASSSNDYDLILNSSFVIASGSGFCHIPAALDIPLLTLNSYQINGIYSRKCIKIPSLLNINGKKVSFAQQINYCYEQDQIGPETETPVGWEVFDATADDILYGAMELIELSKSSRFDLLTPLQIAFNSSLMPLDIPLGGLSRISQFFLEKNSDRLYNK